MWFFWRTNDEVYWIRKLSWLWSFQLLQDYNFQKFQVFTIPMQDTFIYLILYIRRFVSALNIAYLCRMFCKLKMARNFENNKRWQYR